MSLLLDNDYYIMRAQSIKNKNPIIKFSFYKARKSLCYTENNKSNKMKNILKTFVLHELST